MQKQRFKVKKEKVITLQEAWDVVAEELSKRGDGGSAYSFYVDNLDSGRINLHSARGLTVVESTKIYGWRSEKL